MLAVLGFKKYMVDCLSESYSVDCLVEVSCFSEVSLVSFKEAE